MKPRFVSRSRVAVFVAALASLAALGADCEGNVVQDPTFRDWCGSSLCAWTLDSGHVARVATWNENDFGVSFTDVGTQISQVTQEHDATCLLFTTIADIDPSAQMSLSVDFNNDGTIDFQGPLGATSWHKVETEITAPVPYSGITFHVRKQGTGAAVLAEMRVVSTTGCKAPADRAPFLLGEGCKSDTDCATGLVCASTHVCSQCDETRPCPGGVACASQALNLLQCGPGQGLGQAGAPCVVAADCASGSCEGASVSTLATLFDAADAGCPTSGPICEVSATLDAGADACSCVVSHGGTCR
jgi:hypothetical protein